MKKLLLILLLSPLPLSASELYESFDDIAVGARKSLGIDTATSVGLSDAHNEYWCREGLLALQPLMKGDEVEWVFTTTYNQPQYTIDSSIIWISMVRWAMADSVKILLPIPMVGWDKVEHKTTLNRQKFLKHPSYYDWTDDYLFLYPVPTLKNGAYDTIRVIGYRAVSDLNTITTLTHLKERYRIAVKKYVTWQAAQSNYDIRTAHFRQEYESAVAVLRGEKVNAKTSE